VSMPSENGREAFGRVALNPGAGWADRPSVNVGGINSTLSTVLAGFQQAQDQETQATESLLTPGGDAPVDSAEFSDAAMAASPDGIAAAVTSFHQAKDMTDVLVFVARAVNEQMKQTLDLLA